MSAIQKGQEETPAFWHRQPAGAGFFILSWTPTHGLTSNLSLRPGPSVLQVIDGFFDALKAFSCKRFIYFFLEKYYIKIKP